MLNKHTKRRTNKPWTLHLVTPTSTLSCKFREQVGAPRVLWRSLAIDEAGSEEAGVPLPRGGRALEWDQGFALGTSAGQDFHIQVRRLLDAPGDVCAASTSKEVLLFAIPRYPRIICVS